MICAYAIKKSQSISKLMWLNEVLILNLKSYPNEGGGCCYLILFKYNFTLKLNPLYFVHPYIGSPGPLWINSNTPMVPQNDFFDGKTNKPMPTYGSPFPDLKSMVLGYHQDNRKVMHQTEFPDGFYSRFCGDAPLTLLLLSFYHDLPTTHTCRFGGGGVHCSVFTDLKNIYTEL